MLQTQSASDLPMAIPPPSIFRAYRARVKSKESPDILISAAGDDQRGEFSQSFDFANLRSERRNSFSAFFGLASRQRWGGGSSSNDSGGRNASVPGFLARPSTSTSALTGSISGSGKHRGPGLKLYHYLNMKGVSPDRDGSGPAIAPAYHQQHSQGAMETDSRLEDEFEKIKCQLAEMSQESGQFKQRIQTLSRAVNDLQDTISQQQFLDEEDDDEDEGGEIEDEEEEDQLSDECVCENSPSSLVRVLPPNGWESVASSIADSSESIPRDNAQGNTNLFESSSCKEETDLFDRPLCVISVEDADSANASSEGEEDDFFASVIRQFAPSS